MPNQDYFVPGNSRYLVGGNILLALNDRVLVREESQQVIAQMIRIPVPERIEQWI